jgi:hypothetical protein
MSPIARDPKAGSAKLMNHSNFRNVAAAFLSRRFFSANSLAMVAKVFTPSSTFAAFAACLTWVGSSPWAKVFLAPSRASRASLKPTSG